MTESNMPSAYALAHAEKWRLIRAAEAAATELRYGEIARQFNMTASDFEHLVWDYKHGNTFHRDTNLKIARAHPDYDERTRTQKLKDRAAYRAELQPWIEEVKAAIVQAAEEET